MALITAGAAASSGKQIVIRGTSTPSIMYTVPSGKTFVGMLFITGQAYIAINGVDFYQVTSGPVLQVPITLTAGTTVSTTNSSYYSFVLLGVES